MDRYFFGGIFFIFAVTCLIISICSVFIIANSFCACVFFACFLRVFCVLFPYHSYF